MESSKKKLRKVYETYKVRYGAGNRIAPQINFRQGAYLLLSVYLIANHNELSDIMIRHMTQSMLSLKQHGVWKTYQDDNHPTHFSTCDTFALRSDSRIAISELTRSDHWALERLKRESSNSRISSYNLLDSREAFQEARKAIANARKIAHDSRYSSIEIANAQSRQRLEPDDWEHLGNNRSDGHNSDEEERTFILLQGQ